MKQKQSTTLLFSASVEPSVLNISLIAAEISFLAPFCYNTMLFIVFSILGLFSILYRADPDIVPPISSSKNQI